MLNSIHQNIEALSKRTYQRAKPVARLAWTVLMTLSILMTSVGVGPSQAAPAANIVGQGFTVTPADLAFILKQIKIAEKHSNALLTNTPPNPNPTGDPVYCQSMVGTGVDQIPNPLLSFGIRTVDGSCNNLQPGQSKYGAADQTFPRLTAPVFGTAEDSTVPGVGPVGPLGLTSYAQTGGVVVDSEPRLISNLIVDQTSTNPAAVQAAGFPLRSQGGNPVEACTTEPSTPGGNDGLPEGCVPQFQTLFIENVTTDAGLSPPFNGLFTIFGQFFDHGLDKITNGGNGAVLVPLRADDPLIAGFDHILGTADDIPANMRFMPLTRGKIVAGADGFRNALNTDTPFVDQSQTYTSHASHQIFTREFVNNNLGRPVSTGKFLSSADGGLPTWEMVKTQAATMLGLQLADSNVGNIPMILSDPYGKFIPGPLRGLPQYVTTTPGVFVEGNIDAPVSVPANAIFIDTAFLNDIAHSAAPTAGGPDSDNVAGGSLDTTTPAGSYDDELLDLHAICGDGRCNENIALQAVHQIFHNEHDRLVDYIENVIITDTSGVTNAADWQLTAGANGWNGERLFQAARFVTEMEYQHLVFEEFARKVQPGINPFEPFAFNQTDVNPAITAEFAHAVYRFGHSMLTEEIARTNADGTTNNISLFEGFLNPAEYYRDGFGGTLSSRDAAGAIIMGMSDQAGNEIDEFVTDVLRNRLVGLPLDLAAINMTRSRSEGIPPLNSVRRQIFAATNDGSLRPYTDWVDFGLSLKHPESLVNFVAAYGSHTTIASLTTLEGRRTAADQIVNGTVLPGPDNTFGTNCGTVDASPECADDIFPPTDSADFMFGLNSWAGVNTGLEDVDLWMGGLAEHTNTFGGLLGSTFNYVFENQLTNLQNGDRFYYLARTPGMNLRAQLEGNSFAELVMRNTNAHTLKADPFATADCKFELGSNPGIAGPLTGPGNVSNDPNSDCNETALLIRMADGTIRYRLINSVDPSGINSQSVYNGRAGDFVDRIFGGTDNDTFWGGLGNDIIEGGDGADIALGGEGNDILTDLAGDDVPKGGPGNDAIDAGPGLDIIMGGEGKDFMNGGANTNEIFAAEGDDFAIAGQGMDAVFGDSGDDWIEGGDQPDLLIGDSSSLFFDDNNLPGHDIFIGQGGDDDYDSEGGDDILVAGPGVEKNAGTAGYDWSIGLGDPQPQNADLALLILATPPPANEVRDRFNELEALSGWMFDDILRGDSLIPSQIGGGGFIGCDALDQSGLDRIAGLDALVPPLEAGIGTPIADVLLNSVTQHCLLTGDFVWGGGNILLGGAGSDVMEGRGGDDIIDGDKYLNVRLSIRTNPSDALTEIGSTNLMENAAVSGNFGPGTTSMTLQQAVFAGLLDPGNIVSVREILDPGNGTDVDTAVFSSPLANFIITPQLDGSVTVTDNTGAAGGALGGNEVDILWNIEQLQFCESAIDPVTGLCPAADILTVPLVSLLAPNATGTVTINSLTPIENQLLTANAAGIVDPDGVGTVTISWQSEITPGNWVGVGTGDTFTPLNNTVGFPLRGVASFFDGFGTLETVIGDVTAPVINVNDAPIGAPTLDSNTPDVGVILNASAAAIVDLDGLVGVTFSFQWQANGLNIPAATGSSFVPTEAERGKTLRVVVSFTDNHGTLEALASGSTNAVPAPIALVTPGSLAFGSIPVGNNSTSQTITVTNSGNATLTVSGASISPLGQFSVVSSDCLTVVPGASCTIDVRFTPTSIGLKNATIGIIHDGLNGSPSNVSLSGTGTAPATAPSAPTIGAPVQGNGSITVNWTAPANNGGSPITGYEVRVVNNATNAQVGALLPAAANATGLSITGLTVGTAYRFSVRAANIVGSGAFSAETAAVVFATAPGAPVIGIAVRGANGAPVTATANWTPPINTGGIPIQNYRVFALIMSSNRNNATVLQEFASPLQPNTVRSFTFTFTQTNLNVRFQVEAINAVGTGPRSIRSGNVVPR